MVSKNESENRGWAVFGKVSLVIVTIGTVIAAIIGILQWLQIGEPDVSGTCYFLAIDREVNPDFSDRTLVSDEEVSELADPLLSSEETGSDFDVFGILLRKLVRDKALQEVRRHNYTSNPNVICRLENAGDRAANDLVLSSGVRLARVTRDGGFIAGQEPGIIGAYESGIFNYSLGDLSPAGKTEVQVWTRSRIFPTIERFIFSHHDGVVDLSTEELLPPNERFSPLPKWPLWLMAVALFALLIRAIYFKYRAVRRTAVTHRANTPDGQAKSE